MEQDFHGNSQVNFTWFFAFFSGVLDWIVLILVWFERSLHCAHASGQSCPSPLKLMTSQAVEGTWVCTGGSGANGLRSSHTFSHMAEVDFWHIDAWEYSYFEKGCRKLICARNNPEREYGIWSITCSWHCSCRTYHCCFPLATANISPWPLVPFLQISLKNSEFKTTHNTFRNCRVHFFRQPFPKQLYTCYMDPCNFMWSVVINVVSIFR